MSAARLALLLSIIGVGVLTGLSAIVSGPAWLDIISWTFIVLPTAVWAAAIVLYKAHRQRPDARNLGERSIVALRDALVATIGAILGLNRVVPLGWPTGLAIGLLAIALLLISAYSIAWLIQWYRGRWD